MSSTKKRRRDYHSPLRQQQADATRAEILDAAQSRFAEQGYAATSIEAIAKQARVSPRTVYLAFGTKVAIVAALVERLKLQVDVGGQFRELVAEKRPVEKLRISATITRHYSESGWHILETLHGAVAVERELAAIWKAFEDRRHAGQATLVAGLANALRDGLTVDEATDILWAMSAHDNYRLFVGARGWTPDRFERWLFESSRRLLLAR